MPLGKKSAKGGDKREKLSQDLFKFQKCVESGFPSKCSAIAYDDRLKLLAIGTKTGRVQIYGQQGVEFSGLHADEKEVLKILFVPEQARLITLCVDNTVHLWEMNFDSTGQGLLEEVRCTPLLDADRKPISVSTYCLSHDAQTLFLGTENSLIYMLRVADLNLIEAPLRPDVLLGGLPKKFQSSPGSVEGLALNPHNGSQLLIAYAHGLIVSYAVNDVSGAYHHVDAAYHCEGVTIQSLSVHRDGNQLVTAHEDGSYVYWHLHPEASSSDEELSVDENDDSTHASVSVMKLKKKPTVVYGPASCKPITKISVKSSDAGDMLVLIGGMPRATHGDKFTVSVTRDKQQVTYELTSKVIDYVVIDSDDSYSHVDNPDVLLILAEEELIAIDLQSATWQQMPTPYMPTIHSSAITFSSHFTNMDTKFLTKLRSYGEAQLRRFNQSVRGWPLTGGRVLPQETQYCARDVFVTGHESGAVCFWDASSPGSISWLCKLSTAKLFKGEFADAIDAYVEEQQADDISFRKVGTYDPYSDDPRLAVQKVVICSEQLAIAVGGAAGQVMVFRLVDTDRPSMLPITNRELIKCDIVKSDEKFVWKGWEALPLRDTPVSFPAGFQPDLFVELNPPAAISALDFSAMWNVLVAGTAHGYTIVDAAARKVSFSRCTLNLADEMARQAAQAGPMQRMRSSLKKSLRQSFRRMRRARDSVRRSMRRKTNPNAEKKGKLAQAAGKEKVLRGQAQGQQSPDLKPVERAIEAHVDQKDINTGLIRTALLAETYVTSHQRTPAAIVGTTGGVALLHAITLPAAERRATETVRCDLSKELQLQHKAAIIQLAVIREPDMSPVGSPDVAASNSPGRGVANAQTQTQPHYLLVFSEEQIKLFSLPSLKPKCKAKLTAVDGQLIRKATVAYFRASGAQDEYVENDIMLLTNLGELRVYHVDAHAIRCEMQAACIKQQDAVGINACSLTRNGHGYYASSPSEFMRFSVSSRNQQAPRCGVAIAEQGRAIKKVGRPVSTMLPLVPGAPPPSFPPTLSPANLMSPAPTKTTPQAKQQPTLAMQTTPKGHNAPVTSTPITPPKNAEDPTAVYYSMPPGPDTTAVYYSMPPADPQAVYYSMPPKSDPQAVYYSMPPLPGKAADKNQNQSTGSKQKTQPMHDDDDDDDEDGSESGAEAQLQAPTKAGFKGSLQANAKVPNKNGAHGDEDYDDEDAV